jgi:putative restriction endonuclease
MDFKEYYQNELNNSQSEYFILDTKGDEKTGDIDFVKYSWSRSKFNKIKVGDLVIFRRPGKASETNKFYFFGAAKMGKIEGMDRVTGLLEKCYPFNEFIHQEELIDFKWTFKQRGENWEHFFNQYGMNKINKTDFEELMKISESHVDWDFDKEPEAEVDASKDIQTGNYEVDDKEGKTKIRAKQQVFSNKVKTNYNNQCAICSIKTKEFLIGSHIIPWAKRKDIRIKPSNGICLCSFHDKAFDLGYISLSDDLKVILTQIEIGDEQLTKELSKINGIKIFKPKNHAPEKEFLKYHRENILKK